MPHPNPLGEAKISTPRYESLDLWRGVACLLVVFCHSVYYARVSADSPVQVAASGVVGVARWGWLGVPLFFVISGYCISACVDSARRRQTGAGEYFWRRFRRIYPPYWCFVLLSVLVLVLTEDLFWPGLFVDSNHSFPHPRDLTGWQWFGGLTLTETWRHHLIGGEKMSFALHAWTLCYEEQFYAVSGLVLLLAPRRLFQVFGLLSLGVLVLKHVAGWCGFADSLSGFFFDGRWLVFAAGALVYYQVSRASPRVTLFTRLTLLLGVAYALRTPSSIDPGELCAFSFALALSLLHPLDQKLATLPLLRPLRFCGTMCYSVYLIHYPLVKGLSHALSLAGLDGPVATIVLTLPICLVVSLVAAYVFHQLVEKRFLNAPRPASPAVVAREARVLQGVQVEAAV